MKIQILLVTLCILLGALSFPGCSSSTIPPSVEELSPTQPQPVEYIARPATVLGTVIFSDITTEQEKKDIWSESRGKWVLWSGIVHGVEPKLKPSRIVFVYEYETSGWALYSNFGVAVDFKPAMTERLKQLTKGESVYYRAKLVQREVGGLFQFTKYDSDISGFLVLEEGEIIASDDPEAVLVDLVYSSYEHLDRLVADAERIAAISDYFERKANLASDVKWNLTKLALKLMHIELHDDTQLHEISLPAVRMKASLAKSEIEDNLKATLAFLHYDAGAHGEYERQDIERKIESSERIVNIIEDEIKDLESIWEKDKRSAEPGIVDLISVAIIQLANVALPGVGLVIGIPKAAGEGVTEIMRLPLYQQVIVICQTYLGLIDEYTLYIRNTTIDIVSNIAGTN